MKRHDFPPLGNLSFFIYINKYCSILYRPVLKGCAIVRQILHVTLPYFQFLALFAMYIIVKWRPFWIPKWLQKMASTVLELLVQIKNHWF